MGELPTKLIKEAMKELADIMDNQGCNTRQRYKTVGDLLGPVRYFQWQIMRIVRLTFIWTTIHQQIEPLDADIMIESFPMQQLEAYIRLFQDPATLELPELCLAGPNAVRDIMSPPVMEPADDALDPTTSEPPVLCLAGPDAVRDAMSPPVMAPADDAFDPTTSGPPVLSLAGPDTVRDATSPPVMAPAEDALGRQQPSATSFSGESNDLPGMTARTMATTDNNKKSNVTPATPSLADPTLGDDRGIETYISCIVPLSTYSETLCALQKVSKGKDKRTSYYSDDSDDSQARARNQGRFCRDLDGSGRNQTDEQYAVKAERRKTRNVKSVKLRHSPDT